MEFGRAVAERDSKRHFARRAVAAALECRRAVVGPPHLAAHPVVDDDRRVVDRDVTQLAPRHTGAQRSKKPECIIGCHPVRAGLRIADLKTQGTVVVANQRQHRSLDSEPRRLDPATEQRAGAKARRHFWKARQLLAV
jgi:hypothetical protein